MSAAKAKMKKQAELKDKLDALLKRFGMQADLAKELKVDQATVSRWLAGKLPPEGYMKLGNVAEAADRLWFWERAGIDIDRLLLAAAEELKVEPVQAIRPLLSRVPADAQLFPVTEKMGGAFPPGDAFVLEPAADQHDSRPFLDQIALVEFPPREQRPAGWAAEHWPMQGLYVGRLRCKPYAWGADRKLSYVLTLGPLNDSKPMWSPHDDVLVIGSWTYSGPPEQPAEGSRRQKAQERRAEVYALYEKERERHTRASLTYDYDGRLKEAATALSLAESEIKAALEEEMRDAEQEAKALAPQRVELHRGVRIIGRVIAWFAAPKRKDEGPGTAVD